MHNVIPNKYFSERTIMKSYCNPIVFSMVFQKTSMEKLLCTKFTVTKGHRKGS